MNVRNNMGMYSAAGAHYGGGTGAEQQQRGGVGVGVGGGVNQQPPSSHHHTHQQQQQHPHHQHQQHDAHGLGPPSPSLDVNSLGSPTGGGGGVGGRHHYLHYGSNTTSHQHQVQQEPHSHHHYGSYHHGGMGQHTTPHPGQQQQHGGSHHDEQQHQVVDQRNTGTGTTASTYDPTPPDARAMMLATTAVKASTTTPTEEAIQAPPIPIPTPATTAIEDSSSWLPPLDTIIKLKNKQGDSVRRIPLSMVLDTMDKGKDGKHKAGATFVSFELLLSLAVQHSPYFPDLLTPKDRKTWDEHATAASGSSNSDPSSSKQDVSFISFQKEMIRKYHMQHHAWIVDFSYPDEDGDEISFVNDEELLKAIRDTLLRNKSDGSNEDATTGGGNKNLFRCSVTLKPRESGVESYLKGTGGAGGGKLMKTLEQQNAQLSSTVALQQEQIRLLTQTQMQMQAHLAGTGGSGVSAPGKGKGRSAAPQDQTGVKIRSGKKRAPAVLVGDISGPEDLTNATAASQLIAAVAKKQKRKSLPRPILRNRKSNNDDGNNDGDGNGEGRGGEDEPMFDLEEYSTPEIDSLPPNVKLAIQHSRVPPDVANIEITSASAMQLTKLLAESVYRDQYKYMHFVPFDNGAHEWCFMPPDFDFGKRTTREIFQMWMCPDLHQRVAPVRFLKAHHFKYVMPPTKSVHHPDHIPAKVRITKNDTPNVVKRFQELRPFMGLFEKEVRELGLWNDYPTPDEVGEWYDQVHEIVYAPMHEYPIVPRKDDQAVVYSPSGKAKKAGRKSYSQLRWSTVVSYLSDSLKKAGKPNWRVEIQNHNRQFDTLGLGSAFSLSSPLSLSSSVKREGAEGTNDNEYEEEDGDEQEEEEENEEEQNHDSGSFTRSSLSL